MQAWGDDRFVSARLSSGDSSYSKNTVEGIHFRRRQRDAKLLVNNLRQSLANVKDRFVFGFGLPLGRWQRMPSAKTLDRHRGMQEEIDQRILVDLEIGRGNDPTNGNLKPF